MDSNQRSIKRAVAAFLVATAIVFFLILVLKDRIFEDTTIDSVKDSCLDQANISGNRLSSFSIDDELNPGDSSKANYDNRKGNQGSASTSTINGNSKFEYGKYGNQNRDSNPFREHSNQNTSDKSSAAKTTSVLIKGRVVSSKSQKGICGANVAVLYASKTNHHDKFELEGFGGARRRGSGHNLVETDGFGSFILPGYIDKDLLGSIDVTLVAFISNHKEFSFGIGHTTLKLEKNNNDVTIIIKGSASVSGYVRDENNIGIPNIQINLKLWYGENKSIEEKTINNYYFRKANKWAPSTSTDIDGNFKISNLIPGEYWVCVPNNQKGYVFAKIDGNYTQKREILLGKSCAVFNILEGIHSYVGFLASKEPGQHIHVSDMKGIPIARAFCRMSFYPARGEGMVNPKYSYTDQAGNAKLPLPFDVREDYPYRLLIAGKGYENLYTDIKYSKTRVIKIKLEKIGSKLTGRVIDATGEPLRGIRVKLSYDKNEERMPISAYIDETSTDEQGQFVFDVLKSNGRHTLLFQSRKYRIADKKVQKKWFSTGVISEPFVMNRR